MPKKGRLTGEVRMDPSAHYAISHYIRGSGAEQYKQLLYISVRICGLHSTVADELFECV